MEGKNEEENEVDSNQKNVKAERIKKTRTNKDEYRKQTLSYGIKSSVY
jgi:hypothetical protein